MTPTPKAEDVYGEDIKQEIEYSLKDLKLIKTQKGKLIKCAENINRLLERHPKFKGKFRFDEFSQEKQYLENDTWRRVTDELYNKIQRDVQSMYVHFADYGRDLMIQSIELACYLNKVDTAKDWMNSIKWDGENRLESFCMNAYGVEDNFYHRLVGKNFWLGMAARVFMPGCHHKMAFILEGAQNLKKSQSFRAIAGDDWFLEDAPLPDNNINTQMTTWGKLIVEFSEGVVFSAVNMGKLKAVISSPIDTVSKKYERNPTNLYRRHVFVITTNQSFYLMDRTGNVRFFPVKISQPVHVEWIKENREQLFAEAAERINQGEKWWNEEVEAIKVFEEEQSKRLIDSTLEEKVEQFIFEPAHLNKMKEGFLIREVFSYIYEDKQPRRSEEMNASSYLKEFGFEKTNAKRINGIWGRFWYAPKKIMKKIVAGQQKETYQEETYQEGQCEMDNVLETFRM